MVQHKIVRVLPLAVLLCVSLFVSERAAAQFPRLEMNLYADIDGQLVGPDEQIAVPAGETVRYVLMAEMGIGPTSVSFVGITADLVPFDCGGQGEVVSFSYGPWASNTTPPTIQGGSILGIEAYDLSFAPTNPVEVLSFEVANSFGPTVYTASGTSPGGVAFTVFPPTEFTASVFAAPRVVAVGSPGAGFCSSADLAEPFGVLDLADILAFVEGFTAGACRADFSPPWTVLDLSDLTSFVEQFVDGCGG